MKTAIFLAAAAAASGVHGGVHKMKLKKVPLADQLVCTGQLLFDRHALSPARAMGEI